MLRTLLLFVSLALLLFVLRPSATLMDRIVASATDNRLRIAETQGHLWRGSGMLAISGDRNALTPMRQVEWDISADWRRLRVRVALAEHGRHQASIAIGSSDVSLDIDALEVPVRLIARAIAHPAARIGWGGSLALTSPGLICNRAGVCEGTLLAQWRDVTLDILPDRHLGDHAIEVFARGNAFDIVVATLQGDIRIDGEGRLGSHEAAFFRGSVEGDAEIVDRIPNIMDRNARPTGQPGRVLISFP